MHTEFKEVYHTWTSIDFQIVLWLVMPLCRFYKMILIEIWTDWLALFCDVSEDVFISFELVWMELETGNYCISYGLHH